MIPFAMGLDAAVAVLKRYKVLILVLPLLLALGVQSCRLKSAKSDLTKAQATIAQMQTASEAARQAQITLNAQNAHLSQRIAENATLAHVQNSANVAAAVSNYANRNSLRKACGSLTSQADPAAVPDHPGAPDSPDGNEVVAVPRSNFEALSKDALRGAESRAFLIDLANEGLAVIKPVPAPSQP